MENKTPDTTPTPTMPILQTAIFGLIGVSMAIDLVEKTSTGLKTFSKYMAGDRCILLSFESLSSTKKFWLKYNLANLINSGNFQQRHFLDTKSVTLIKEILQHKETIPKKEIPGINARIENSKKINLENLKRTIEIPLSQIKLTLLVKFTLIDMDTPDKVGKLFCSQCHRFHSSHHSNPKQKKFLYQLKVREWERKNNMEKDKARKIWEKNKNLPSYKDYTWDKFWYENHYTSWKFFASGEVLWWCLRWGTYKIKKYIGKHDGRKSPFEFPMEIYIIPKKDGQDELSGYYFQTNKPYWAGGELTHIITEHALKKLIEVFTMVPITFKKTTEIIDKLIIQLPNSSNHLDDITENLDPFTTIYETPSAHCSDSTKGMDKATTGLDKLVGRQAVHI